MFRDYDSRRGQTNQYPTAPTRVYEATNQLEIVLAPSISISKQLLPLDNTSKVKPHTAAKLPLHRDMLR